MFSKKTKLVIAALVTALIAVSGIVPLTPDLGLAVSEVVDVLL